MPVFGVLLKRKENFIQKMDKVMLSHIDRKVSLLAFSKFKQFRDESLHVLSISFDVQHAIIDRG